MHKDSTDPWIPTVERAVLICWLLKDLGWMSTDVIIGWFFGGIAVILHVILLVKDWNNSVAYRFYHSSLLMWVVGNYLWMTVEFMVYPSSSNIHIGPDYTPLGGMPHSVEVFFVVFKSWLFGAAVLLQVVLYIGYFKGFIEMPRDEESLPAHTNIEIGELLEEFPEMEEEVIPAQRRPFGLSMTCVEHMYILLWVCKDYFWSWATGDFIIHQPAGYITEACSLLFGSLSVLLFFYVMYINRLHFVNLLDALTSWCWLFANFTWMAGEIFIRYQNLTLDDENQGDDGSTRLASAIFFMCGLVIQFIVIFHLAIQRLQPKKRRSLGFVELHDMSDSSNDVMIGINERHVVDASPSEVEGP